MYKDSRPTGISMAREKGSCSAYPHTCARKVPVPQPIRKASAAARLREKPSNESSGYGSSTSGGWKNRRSPDDVLGPTLEDRIVEYVDHLHEHFVDPVVIRNGRYVAPTAAG